MCRTGNLTAARATSDHVRLPSPGKSSTAGCMLGWLEHTGQVPLCHFLPDCAGVAGLDKEGKLSLLTEGRQLVTVEPGKLSTSAVLLELELSCFREQACMPMANMPHGVRVSACM